MSDNPMLDAANQQATSVAAGQPAVAAPAGAPAPYSAAPPLAPGGVPAPPAPAAPAAAAPYPTTTGTYPSANAAMVAACTWNPVKLTYGQWVLATMDEYPGEPMAYYLSETTPDLYADYCRFWAICQAERSQPGPNGMTVGQFMDQWLGT